MTNEKITEILDRCKGRFGWVQIHIDTAENYLLMPLADLVELLEKQIPKKPVTREDINQIYYLNKEIEKYQEELQALQEGGLQAPKLDGMPRQPKKITDPTGKKVVDKDDVEMIIEKLILEVEMKRKAIYEYIATLDSSLMRQIIMYRCLNLCRWDDVARYVGGGNTADSVRMMFNRHFEKQTCSECSVDV